MDGTFYAEKSHLVQVVNGEQEAACNSNENNEAIFPMAYHSSSKDVLLQGPSPNCRKSEHTIRDHPLHYAFQSNHLNEWFQPKRQEEKKELDLSSLINKNVELKTQHQSLILRNKLLKNQATLLNMENQLLKEELNKQLSLIGDIETFDSEAVSSLSQEPELGEASEFSQVSSLSQEPEIGEGSEFSQ